MWVAKASRSVLIAPLAAALSLAACSNEPDDAAASEEPVAAAPATVPAPNEPAAPTGSPDDIAAAGEATIPAGYHGRWVDERSSCDAPPEIAKTSMTIGGEQIRFYEATAKPGNVIMRDKDHLRAKFDMTGEGQAWVQDIDLRLIDGGARMTRRDRGENALPGQQTYIKC